MIVLGDAIFVGIPKTGSTWVASILRSLGGTVWLGPHTDPGRAMYLNTFAPRHRGKADGKQFFTFVRHPATWYRSAWAYFFRDSRHGSLAALRWINCCASQDYDTFLNNVIERCQGFLSEAYDRFCGPPGAAIRTARIEDVHYQLGVILGSLAGLDPRRIDRIVAETPPANTSANLPPINVKLSNRICELEHLAMQRFNYQPVRADGSVEVGGRIFQ